MSIPRTNGSEQTRQQILSAALRLFAAHGYAGTSTQAIIAAAQVSKPVLYYYFGSKAGLFRVIVDETEDRLLKVILKSRTAASDVHGQLVEICAGMFQFARDNQSAIALALDLSSASRRCPGRMQSLGKVRDRHVIIREIMEQGVIEGCFRKEIKTEDLVVAYLGVINSHIVHFLSNPQWPLSKRRAEDVVFSFLNGTAPACPMFLTATNYSVTPCPTS